MADCKILLDEALVKYYESHSEEPLETVTISTKEMEGILIETVDFSNVWGHRCTLVGWTDGEAEYRVEDV